MFELVNITACNTSEGGQMLSSRVKLDAKLELVDPMVLGRIRIQCIIYSRDTFIDIRDNIATTAGREH